jgi:hypothetical protein
LENIDYTFFNKSEVRAQFKRLKKELTTSFSPDEIASLISKILVNRTVLTKTFNELDEDLILYRISRKFEDFNINEKSSYSYPPNPNQQRANIASKPVLYTSFDVLTALSEMKEQIEIGEIFYISKWRISFKNPVIAHLLIVNTTTSSSTRTIGKLSQEQIHALKETVKNIPQKFQVGYIESIKQMGDLYTTPTKEYYHITSAYSHNILYKIREQKAYVDMLIYPAVESRQNSINIAIHPDLVNSNKMNLEEAYEVTLKENTLKNEKNGIVSIDILKKGVFSKGTKVQWLSPVFSLTNINFHELQIYTYNESLFKGQEAYSKKIINKGITVKDWLEKLINDKDFSTLSSKHLPAIDSQDILEEDIIQIKHQLLFEMDHGNKIETLNDTSCIKLVSITLEIKYEYVPS